MKRLNQTQLSKELNLPKYVIRQLRRGNILTAVKSGRSILFSAESVEAFKNIFQRENHFTLSEFKEFLVEKNFYDQFNPLMKLVINKFDFSVTVKNLITMGKLQSVKLGRTVYITKESANKTLVWLNDLDEKQKHLFIGEKLVSNNKKPKFGKKTIFFKKQTLNKK